MAQLGEMYILRSLVNVFIEIKFLIVFFGSLSWLPTILFKLLRDR
jgi:hypothetical protein